MSKKPWMRFFVGDKVRINNSYDIWDYRGVDGYVIEIRGFLSHQYAVRLNDGKVLYGVSDRELDPV